MPTNLSDTTINLTSIIQILSPVAVAVVGGASWTIKRIVGKTEAAIEGLQEAFDELENRCKKAEDRIRKERADAIRELGHELGDLRKSCELCRGERSKQYTDCVSIYGKFGARLTKLEAEHSLRHKEGCSL